MAKDGPDLEEEAESMKGCEEMGWGRIQKLVGRVWGKWTDRARDKVLLLSF